MLNINVLHTSQEGYLRDAMRNTCSSVYIVATGPSPESGNAITITSFTVVSLEPAIILFCVNKTSRFAGEIILNEKFSVNFMHCEQKRIAEICSKSDVNEKFKHANWIFKNQFAYLSDSNSVLLCSKISVEETGSHMIVQGAVINVLGGENKPPLLYHNRSYAEITSPVESFI